MFSVFLPRIAALVCMLLLAGCQMLSLAAPDGDVAEDPALSDDPAKAPPDNTFVAVSEWRWNDSAQKWEFPMPASSAPRLLPDAWIFESSAVNARVVAAQQLNLYRGRPHSVVAKVVLLSDAKPFDERRATSFGLQDILKKDNFDPAVLSVQTLNISPGTDLLLALDRPQGARYIAIVVGFFDLDGRRSARLVPIPAMPGESWWQKLLGKLTFKSQSEEPAPEPHPAKIKMLLKLGVDRIDQLRVIPQ